MSLAVCDFFLDDDSAALVFRSRFESSGSSAAGFWATVCEFWASYSIFSLVLWVKFDVYWFKSVFFFVSLSILVRRYPGL